MSKNTKTKVGQFDEYKKWTSDKGYTFLAKDKKDAEAYLKMMSHLGSLPTLTEVVEL